MRQFICCSPRGPPFQNTTCESILFAAAQRQILVSLDLNQSLRNVHCPVAASPRFGRAAPWVVVPSHCHRCHRQGLGLTDIVTASAGVLADVCQINSRFLVVIIVVCSVSVPTPLTESHLFAYFSEPRRRPTTGAGLRVSRLAAVPRSVTFLDRVVVLLVRRTKKAWEVTACNAFEGRDRCRQDADIDLNNAPVHGARDDPCRVLGD